MQARKAAIAYLKEELQKMTPLETTSTTIQNIVSAFLQRLASDTTREDRLRLRMADLNRIIARLQEESPPVGDDKADDLIDEGKKIVLEAAATRAREEAECGRMFEILDLTFHTYKNKIDMITCTVAQYYELTARHEGEIEQHAQRLQLHVEQQHAAQILAEESVQRELLKQFEELVDSYANLSGRYYQRQALEIENRFDRRLFQENGELRRENDALRRRNDDLQQQNVALQGELRDRAVATVGTGREEAALPNGMAPN